MRHARNARRKIGSRGAMLLVLAALWGWLFVLPLLIGPTRELDVLYHQWPEGVRATMWAATIVTAAIAAFVPPRQDWFGWVALVLMPAERFFAWVWAGIEHTLSDGEMGEPMWWHQAPLYALLIAAVLVASSMRPPALEAAHYDADGGDDTPGAT